jgi:hypothetical protein
MSSARVQIPHQEGGCREQRERDVVGSEERQPEVVGGIKHSRLIDS